MRKNRYECKKTEEKEGNERESDERMTERKCHIRNGWERMGDIKREREIR